MPSPLYRRMTGKRPPHQKGGADTAEYSQWAAPAIGSQWEERVHANWPAPNEWGIPEEWGLHVSPWWGWSAEWGAGVW